MKKVFLQMMIAFCSIVIISCNKDSQNVEPSVEPQVKAAAQTSELIPVEPNEEIIKRALIVGVAPKPVVPYSMPVTDRWFSKVTYSLLTGDPYVYSEFSRIGNTVYEHVGGKQVASYYVTNSTDLNFLQARNNATNVIYGFPISSPGKYTSSFVWNTTKKAWVESTKYLYAKESVCAGDNEIPKVNTQICKKVRGTGYMTFECTLTNSSHASYPATVQNFTAWLMRTYDITDNCDGNLTIIQTPAPGTLVKAPGTVKFRFDIIDNNNNRLVAEMPVFYAKH